MNGVSFEKYHSWIDFSLVLTSKEIEAPVPKTSVIDIPGADGSLDFSEYFGEIKYKNRKIKFEFSTIVPQHEFLSLFTDIQNKIHGRKMQITIDGDDNFYYVGRVILDKWKADKNVGKITVECDCEPYKYRKYETVRTFTIDSEPEILKGDVNGDGLVTPIDASLVLNEYSTVAAGGAPSFTEKQKLAADMNNDGIITPVDAALILEESAKDSTDVTGGSEVTRNAVEITVHNSRKTVTPELTVLPSAQQGYMYIIIGDVRYRLVAGIYTLPELTLKEGGNRFTISGKAGSRIILKYREGEL